MQCTIRRAPVSSRVAARRPTRAVVTPKALLSTQVVIGGSTLASLAIGRFVFLNYQRRESDPAKTAPKTTGSTSFDELQKPASFISTTNDPAGFGLIDVAGWGALGHAVGYAILAYLSLVSP